MAIESWLMDMDGVARARGPRDPRRAASSSPACASAASPSSSSRTTRASRAATSPRACMRGGLEVPEEAIWTSALATAAFLESQRPGGTGVRRRRDGADDRAARERLHDDRPGARLRRPRRDAHLQLRGDHEGHPPRRGRRALHRHEPGHDRPERRGPAAGDRLGGGDDQPRVRRRALLRRQAQPAHDALRPQRPRRALRDDGDDRRPDGHGHRRRAGGGPRDDPRPHRRHRARPDRALPLPPVAHRRLGRDL